MDNFSNQADKCWQGFMEIYILKQQRDLKKQNYEPA
jgi:hypothetical protein